MEEVEVGLLEGGIGWLAETILENLDADKLDDWIRQVGLADDTKKLRSEIEMVEAVVAAAKGRAIRNKPLFRSLGRVRELLYDADDAVDELDYFRLQQQVQGGSWQSATETLDEHGALQPERPSSNAAIASGSGGNKRSKAWGHFDITEEENGKPLKARCIHCHTVVRCTSDKGTSVLHNHLKSDSCKKKRQATDQQPNPSSIAEATANGISVELGGSGSRKRMRITDESTQNSVAGELSWNKAECSIRIKQIIRELQDARGAVSGILKLQGPDLVGNSNHHTSTTTILCRRTSSLSPCKIYGRDTEKNTIMEIITVDSYDGVTVVPIVGIGGAGKTALAQLVYNDPIVGRQFQHNIWVCVSQDFNEMRLTREMLDFICKEKYEGLCSFANVQETLMTNIKSKRFLLILDDVWDNVNIFQWNKLLVPLKSNSAKGNVILVTTRSMSVANMIGTVNAIKLGALEKEYFWQLFRACAFGDEKYEAHKCLSTIAQQISDKLKGNPLAAETAGELLCRNRNVDRWNNVLKNEDWKSLQLSGGIMSSLKLSYDQLHSHLQRCFLYCSIFPINYRFVGAELVRIWTSQGFIKCSHSNKMLEEIGQGYLSDLVNLGFFELVEREESTLGDQTSYAMCGLMHDFARIISRTGEYTVIDGLHCNKIVPTVRHLTIVIDSEYHTDPCNEKFEKIINNAAVSLRNLRTLVLIVKSAFSFSQSFKDIVLKAQKLRLLQVCSEQTYNYMDMLLRNLYNNFDPLLCNLVNLTHIRYMKIDSKTLPQSLSKFYHLQVLDSGSNLTMPNDMENLVSLQHLVAPEQIYMSIASISGMTALQELHSFNVHVASSSEITLLQSMNQLVQFGVSQLENITSGAEACGARLRDKQNLETLRLFWSDYLPQDKCENARDVLEGLEPRKNLKDLQISGYNGATSPSWLATSLTSLQTLHLERCAQWQILPSLERFPFLRKVELRSMQNVVQISIPSLDELMLIDMPKLERCSCSSIRDLNYSLRVLNIKHCPVLKVFPLFDNCQHFEIEQISWLPHLSKLTIHACPDLHVHNPLPPSTIVSKLSISGVSTLPSMKGSSNGTLTIGLPDVDDDDDFDDIFCEDINQLITLDDKVMSFHNLRFLTRLIISGCQNLTSISFKGVRQLVCLKSLKLGNCPELLSSDVPQELTCEYMSGSNQSALPSLERLHIEYCGTTGKWLSLMLQHAQALQELSLNGCKQITGLSIGEEENSQPNLISATGAASLGYPGRDKLLRLPLNLLSSLKRVSIGWCNDLTFYSSKEDFAGFTSLEEIVILACPKLLSSLTHNDGSDEQSNGRWFLPLSLGELQVGNIDSLKTFQPCFPGNLTSLKKLEVRSNRSLTSLQLHFCTALQELIIENCKSLNSLEGLQSLGNLRLLRADRCLSDYGEYGRCILPQSLEGLYIREYSQEILQPCFQTNLTCLKRLEVSGTGNLKSLELQSCTALEHLKIEGCSSLATLEGLRFLHTLRHLKVHRCPRLPPYFESLSGQGYELCPRLERLEINYPSILTTSFCKNLTSLQYLELCSHGLEMERLTDEEERALQLLTSLQELRFNCCYNLVDLPTGLHNLPSLKRLEIWNCGSIARLLEKGLPPSLEELAIVDCSNELAQQCRLLASKRKVKINQRYVN
ncbi:putative disease resistance protein At3g14460 isoform X1 [Oryza glaberrima]|uniref:putative disease resistance protein At3g14460 isoform X1 n=1 Tax=Oryza glaberrima TaxID=4538 RepID=UPI00224BFE05|nr:putative disease resistance protein At3g14460 isoform X1 [Oryza glaberrima]